MHHDTSAKHICHNLERQPHEIPHEGDKFARAARQKIDEDIHQLRLEIQLLRRRRNELSPTYALPPEVVSKIFILLRDWCMGGYRGDQIQWIRVGHVSHYWREVALACPSLWSIPVFTHPDLAEEMIHRSKTVPLTIISGASHWSREMVEPLEKSMAQLSRIRSIDLDLGNYAEHAQALLPPLSQPTPLLEKITLIASSLTTRDAFYFPVDALHTAPLLRSIDLRGLVFNWSSFKHRDLTSLSLRDSHLIMGVTSTLGQMMDALDHMPNLRVLVLINSIPSHTTSGSNKKTSDFKHLRQLTLVGKAPDCISFLRRIQYPPDAKVELDCTSTSHEDCTTTLSILGQNLYRSQGDTEIHQPPITIRSARLTSLNEGDAEICFFGEISSVRQTYRWSGEGSEIIRICFYDSHIPDRTHDRILVDVYNLFDLSSLEALFVNWRFSSDKVPAIQASLGKLPRLEFIHVSRYFPELCLALTGTSGGPEGKPDETNPQCALPSQKVQDAFSPAIRFPALKAFIIEDVDFRHIQHPENFECLMNMLVERANTDMPIAELGLQACSGIQAWHKKRLGELVVGLEVDGKKVDVKALGPDADQLVEDNYEIDSSDEGDSDESE